ncbi:MAG: carboxypeptidase regulatory-like domain-containing protein [Gemmatimonadales bacterium]
MSRRGLVATLLLVRGSLAAAQPSTGSVQGTVTDTTGRALAGVEISVGRTLVRTNPQGFFRVDGLPAGQYALAARLVGYAPVRIPFTVPPDKPAELRIRLVPAAYTLPEVVVESRRTGYGAVLDSSFAPLMGATVQIFGLKRETTLTDSAGQFALAAPRPGPYLVRVSAKGHGERRIFLELSKGAGRELRFRLTASQATSARDEETALNELGLRLAAGLRTERLTATQLERYQSFGICDIPRIREQVGRSSLSSTTLILNGTRVIKGFPVTALCTWRADEVDLVEFGSDPCRDVTFTIATLINPLAWCSGRARVVTRSMGGSGQPIRAQTSGTSYVVIWEKR